MTRTPLLLVLAGVVGFAAGWLLKPSDVLELDAPDEGTKRTLAQSKSVTPEMAQLVALGYVEGLDDPEIDRSGVYQHEPDRSWDGINLYASSARGEAYLMDMDGQVVHTWAAGTKAWTHVSMLEDGHILAIAKDHALIRVDRDSDVVWVWEGRAHHDVDRLPDGGFVTLSRTSRPDPAYHPEAPVLRDQLVFLDEDGQPTGLEIDLLELVRGSFLGGTLPAMAHLDTPKGGASFDPLHANAVEVFDGAVPGPLFRRGNLLVSLRNINAVVILDGETHEILWVWGPTNITFQHHPTLLDDGTLLVFDNGLERSRVVQVDPETFELVWIYEADDFFTATRGSNQRLPNGNTLVTESDSGYVFEVTPDGERVWSWANPDGDGPRRNAIQRMSRHERPDWL